LKIYTSRDVLEGPRDGYIRVYPISFNLGALGTHIGRDRNHQPVAKPELTRSPCHQTARRLHSHYCRQTVFLSELGDHFGSASRVFIYQDGCAAMPIPLAKRLGVQEN
jgi:hypothetical protein